MWAITLILLYFFSAVDKIFEISAYTTAKSEVIKNELVTNLDFDAAGNSYAIIQSSDSNRQPYRKLYKLNSSNNLAWVVVLPPPTYYGQPRSLLRESRRYEILIDMLVSSRGDTYLGFYGANDFIILIVRNGSRETEVVTEMSSSFFYLDGDDNLFYCEKSFGVKMIRPDLSTDVSIKNLECGSEEAPETAISDKSGNTYFLVRRNGKHTLVWVNRTDLQDANPQATLIGVVDNQAQFVKDLVVDEEDNLWIIVSAYEEMHRLTLKEGFIKKFKNGTMKTVLSGKDREYRGMFWSKDKMFVIEEAKTTHSIFYIKPNDEIVEIPRLKNLPRYSRINGLTDREGQAYFFTTDLDRSSHLGFAITIKPNETKPILLSVPFNSSTKITSAKMDFNDNLWMVTSSEDIFHLKKGETALNVRSDLKGSCRFFRIGIYFNSVTKNMYFLCNNGLFIAENN